jgi:hypothetical protein
MLECRTLFLLFGLAIGQASAYDTLNVSDARFRYAFIVADTSEKFGSAMTEVIVIAKKSGDTLQRWELPSENEGYRPADKPADYLPDVNFDGYSDIGILVNCGAGPNCAHLYYVFDRKTKSFARDTLLERISSATFDAKTRTIRSFWRSSCCWHGEDTYIWKGKKPVLIMQKECRKTDLIYPPSR